MTEPMNPATRVQIETLLASAENGHNISRAMVAKALRNCITEIDRLARLVDGMQQRDADLTADAASWREP